MLLAWRCLTPRCDVIRVFLLLLLQSHLPTIASAGVLQNVLGVPATCIHQNVVRQCRLSFSCWLEGGRHVAGCGDSRWLFSCCVKDGDLMTSASMPAPASTLAINSKLAFAAAVPKPKGSMKMVMMGPPPPLPGMGWDHLPPPLPKGMPYSAAIGHGKSSFFRRRSDQVGALSECGIARTPQNTLQKRIIGGRTANFAEYPWQAHIRIAEYQCGGVLVSRMFVATAAHCIQQARLKDVTIYLGELDTQNSGKIAEPLPAEKHRAELKIVHPKFLFRMTQPDRYDLALLKLTRPAGYKTHILPICLPVRPLDLVGKKGIIAGWGKTDANMGQTGTNILRTAAVPIISTKECLRWHKSKQISVELFNEMFCAGHSDGHQDACLGDSGGPLIINDRGRFTLIGITSAGFGCGVDHQPGIYHNIQKTAKWIQNVILTAS